MLSAFARALAQLPSPEMRTPLLRSAGFACLLFGALWTLLAVLLHTTLAMPGWVRLLVDLLGVLAAPILTWLLFPSVMLMILGLYADAIIDAVERRHYPALSAPDEQRRIANLWSGVRLALIGLALNLLALPLYLLIPGVNLFLFLVLNGYLVGREYFDIVALRRADWRTVQHLWRQNRFRFLLSGILVAGLFALPIINLAAPLIGLAATVHMVQRLRHNGVTPDGDGPLPLNR